MRPSTTAPLALALLLPLLGRAGAEPPRLAWTLAQVEDAALATSSRLRAADQQALAARDRADSQRALLIPRLTLDGSYRYVTEVPSIKIGGVDQPFGDHRATSIGPTLSGTLWDQGALYQAWRSQQAGARSQEDAAALARRQVLLGVRLAYFQVQLALEQVRLLNDSLNLSESQYDDIRHRLQAGSASRADSLAAHQEVLNRKKDFRMAQADLADSLRELFNLTGSTADYDLSRPAGEGSAASEGSPASLFLSLDSLAALPATLAGAAKREFDAAHPQAAQYEDRAESLRLASKSLRAGLWPKIQFSGRASYDYPNGPVLEDVQQNSVGLTASLPLFEASRTSRDADEQKRLAAAAEEDRRRALNDLRRDWLMARDRLAALRDQEELDRESVTETGELARLKYFAYKQGSTTFLEVQSANLGALQAKVAAARTQAQILIQLATLDGLSLGQ